jgi:16S rRNA (cytosine1402-N4)-methyltransferase
MEEGHLPVLAEEVIKMLAPRPGSLHVDCTVGGGGHTERILEAASPGGRVLGLDADPAAVGRVGERLARFGDRLVLRQAGSFSTSA